MWPQIGGDPTLFDIIGVKDHTNNQWIHGGTATGTARMAC